MKLWLARNNVKTFVFGFFCAVIGGCLLAIWLAVDPTTAQITEKKTREIKITVVQQEKSPIVITAANSVVTNVFAPEYTYIVTNNSDRAIRAYTIKSEVLFGKNGSLVNGWDLSHLVASSLLIHPRKSSQVISEGATRYPDEVTEIKLSVDFVELEDGRTWGVDASHSIEILMGEREAAMRHRTPDRVVELDEPEWRQNVPLTTLVRESNMVIIAAPVRNSYRQFQDGHVVTDYQIRVEEVIEGDLIPSSMISVIMPGGLVRESNGEWLRVQTRRLRKMENGKTYLLFLKPAGRGSGIMTTVRGSQGIYEIRQSGSRIFHLGRAFELPPSDDGVEASGFLQTVRQLVRNL